MTNINMQKACFLPLGCISEEYFNAINALFKVNIFVFGCRNNILFPTPTSKFGLSYWCDNL